MNTRHRTCRRLTGENKQQICEQQQQELAQRERKPHPKPWNGGCETRVMRGGRANVNGKTVLLCNNPFYVCKNGRNYCRMHCHGGMYEDIDCSEDESDDDEDEDEDDDEDEDEDDEDDDDFIASESEVEDEDEDEDSEYVPDEDEN